MKKLALIAALAGLCAASTASMTYEPLISQNEINTMMYGLPEGIEIAVLPTRFGICGETATIVMDQNGFQIWCGRDTFMHPILGREGCYGEKLEQNLMFTDVVNTWNDMDCDGIIELYHSGQDGTSVSYTDYSLMQMAESGVLRAGDSVVENAERFLEAANLYDILLFDMRKNEGAELWRNYLLRHQSSEETEGEQ